MTGAEYMVDGGLLAALGVRLPEDDIIDGGMFEYEGGSIKVPDGPGLGVSLDRDKLDEYAQLYKSAEGSMLPRLALNQRTFLTEQRIR